PVNIGSIGATIYPRVSVTLGDVSIGAPARIHAATLRVGADLGALLSRRIEHATVELSGARVELPLPPFAIGAGPSSDPSSKPIVELVSVDTVALRGVEIVSGGRTLSGDVVVAPEGNGVTIEKFALAADKTKIDATGRITNLSG